MRRASVFWGILGLFAVSACESPSEPPAPATEISLHKSHGIESLILGAGQVDLSSVVGASDAAFVFSASVINGRARGHFRQRRERNGLIVDFTGEVTCMTVDAALGRARVGGVITRNNSTDPAFMTENHQVGDDVWFRVQDGEGHDTVDASTTYGFKPTLVNTSAEYCALPFTGLPYWNPASTFPLSSGLILVRP